MTNRNRARRPAARTQARRTGRNVWVNENINAVLVQNSIQAIDCLSAAADFMTFDTTLETVIVPDMAYTLTTTTGAGKRQIRCAFIVGPSTMDADDFQAPFADSIGPPWLGVFGSTAHLANGVLFTSTLAGPGFPIRYKARRRFRENNSTLFLLVQTLSVQADTNIALDGMVRTLLHIP